MHKVILILDKLFLKYEGVGGGRGVKLTPPEKTIVKKPSLIRFNHVDFSKGALLSVLQNCSEQHYYKTLMEHDCLDYHDCLIFLKYLEF